MNFKNTIGAFACISVAFVYGVGFGKYHWWPYVPIQSLKTSWRAEAKPILEPIFRTPTEKYSRLKSQYDLLTTDSIVFIGDSIVEEGRWSEWIPTSRISNRGIGGDSTYGASIRFASLVDSDAEAVILWVGVNDRSRGMSLKDSQNALAQIIQTAIENDIDLFVMTIAHVERSRDELNVRVREQNEMITRLCELHEIELLDVNHFLSNDNAILPRHTNDGIHLKGSGYAAVAEALKELING